MFFFLPGIFFTGDFSKSPVKFSRFLPGIFSFTGDFFWQLLRIGLLESSFRNITWKNCWDLTKLSLWHLRKSIYSNLLNKNSSSRPLKYYFFGSTGDISRRFWAKIPSKNSPVKKHGVNIIQKNWTKTETNLISFS